MLYACPQLINDADSKLFGARDFGSAEVKEECSSDCSDCNKTEGNLTVNFSLVLYCINVRNFGYYNSICNNKLFVSTLQVVAHLSWVLTMKM